MSENAKQQHPMTLQTVLYEAPGMDAVTVQQELRYSGDNASLVMDVYYPPGAQSTQRLPAVVIVAGYPDEGFAQRMGCSFKDMGSTTSWARLIAATGVVAIAYANRDPLGDLHALLAHVRGNASSLRIDEKRLGVWASSGNVPLALSLLMKGARDTAPIACAALCYGITLDLEGATAVAEAARTWGFANASAGKTVDDLSPDTPIFVARAGQDVIPGLLPTLDRFVTQAVALNLPITLANHPAGPHAFDLVEDSATTRAIVRQTLLFLESHLGA